MVSCLASLFVQIKLDTCNHKRNSFWNLISFLHFNIQLNFFLSLLRRASKIRLKNRDESILVTPKHIEYDLGNIKCFWSIVIFKKKDKSFTTMFMVISIHTFFANYYCTTLKKKNSPGLLCVTSRHKNAQAKQIMALKSNVSKLDTIRF
jgi:hypothetical protein